MPKRPWKMRSIAASQRIAANLSLAAVAAAFNAVNVAAGGHALLVQSWRLLLSICSARRHIASPVSPAKFCPEAVLPNWLSSVSEKNALSGLAVARVADVAKAQADWAEQCAAAEQMRQHRSANIK